MKKARLKEGPSAEVMGGPCCDRKSSQLEVRPPGSERDSAIACVPFPCYCEFLAHQLWLSLSLSDK